MKRNVGVMDMTVRLIVGAVLLAIGFAVSMPTVWQIIVFVLAAIAWVTGIVRYCPANAMLGINTCAHSPQEPAGTKESHGPAK